MKRILISLCLSALAYAASAQSVFVYDGITYRVIQDADEATTFGTVAVTASADLPYEGNISIPNAVKSSEDAFADSYKVVAIEKAAFKDCVSLSSVTLPIGIETIGDNAFGGCLSLVSVHFSPLCNLSSLGERTFDGSGLESITIPDGITAIPLMAFNNCKSLKNVVLPPSLKRIDNYAFNYCIMLSDIVLPESLIAIGEGAFSTSGLQRIKIPDNVVSISTVVFCNCIKLEDVLLSPKTVKIDFGAFSGCLKLSKINKPESLKSIDSNAFSWCITIPDYYKAYGAGEYTEEEKKSIYDAMYQTIYGDISIE